MRFLASSLSRRCLCLAAMVVMLGAAVVRLVVGQEAVSSTALSWAFLQSPNLSRQLLFRAFTRFISSVALQSVISDLNEGYFSPELRYSALIG